MDITLSKILFIKINEQIRSNGVKITGRFPEGRLESNQSTNDWENKEVVHQ